MIKCNVAVRGTINKTGEGRTSKDGKSFMAYSENVMIPTKKGVNKTVEVGVVRQHQDVSEVTGFTRGNRIEIEGDLSFKKRGENIYFNLKESVANLQTTEAKDAIKGEMMFRGSVGNKIEMKNDKNGKAYLAFSAYNAEKVANGFEYVWVRFIRFSDEKVDWLCAKTPIEAKAVLDLSFYKDQLNIGC